MSGRSKNHTLKGGTCPYSLCMGIPPPPPTTEYMFSVAFKIQTLVRGIYVWGGEGLFRDPLMGSKFCYTLFFI